MPLFDVAMNIAVIVPVYNEELIIEAFLQQFLQQDFPLQNFQLILVNNNSNDQTLKIIADFVKTQPSLDIQVVTEQTAGIPAARKRGYDVAAQGKCDIILSSDADTQIPNNTLSYVAQQFTEQQLDFFIGNQTFPLQTMLDLLLEAPDLIEYDKSFYSLEKQYFGPRFFGPYSALTRKFYLQLPYQLDNPLIPYEDLLLSRTCYYCGGRYAKSELKVTTSDRRVRSNFKAWISRVRIPTAQIDKNNPQGSFTLTHKQKQAVYRLRLKVGVESLIANFVDALLFAYKYPQYEKTPLRSAQKFCQDMLRESFSSYRQLVAEQQSDPLLIKKKVLAQEWPQLKERLQYRDE